MPNHSLRPCALAILLGAIPSLTAQSPSAAVEAERAPIAVAPNAPPARVFVDQPGDGLIWARGADWKASFGAAGFTFVPFLGPAAPRNFPLRLQLREVRAGGVPMTLDPHPTARVHGTEVAIARGPVTEVYDLDPRGIEQRIVVAERPAAGDLAVAMAVDTELAPSANGDGTFTFANELGGVRVSEAIAIDARGRRCPATAALVAGEYTLTVPAAFVAAAAFPLVIDPFFLSFTITPSPAGLYQLPDVAYVDAGDGFYATVYEEIYSAVDHDVIVCVSRRDGSTVTMLYVDVTTTTWLVPRVASHRIASQFLCVARVGNAIIAGRPIGLAASGSSAVVTIGSQFPIRSSAIAVDPDVGGDATITATLPGNYCVTWGENGDVRYAIVRTDSLVLTPANPVLGLPTVFAARPAISKCCGPQLPGAQDWAIVWEQTSAANGLDIWGALVHFDGSVTSPAFPIEGSPSSDSRPEVSSLTDVHHNTQQWMVVWQRYVPGGPIQNAHDDIWGAIWDGTTPITGPVNLTSLLLRPTFANQWNPCVETDGMRFCVGFAEKASVFSPDVEPYLATVHLQWGTTLAVTAYPELLNAFVEADDNLKVASERSGGTASTRYMAVWDARQANPPLQSCIGAFYRGHLNLGPGPYFNHALPGCGAMTIVPSGLPALGETIAMDLVGAQGLPFLLVGFSVPPVSYCAGCDLGVDLPTAAVTFTSAFTLTIPPDVGLIGFQLAFQGADFFAGGGCAQPIPFTLTDEIIVTIL